MQEHPIPQDITGYKFHLIGNMTIKQFAELAVGVVLAFFFYKTSLPGIFRWPIVAVCAGMGVVAAFVPIEERPLDHWIVAFINVLYKPTKFFWKKEAKIPEPFLYKADESRDQGQALEVDLTPMRKDRVSQFLKSLEKEQVSGELDMEELSRVDNILSAFDQVQVQGTSDQQYTKPSLKIRVRKMHGNSSPSNRRGGTTVVFSQSSWHQQAPADQAQPPISVEQNPPNNSPSPNNQVAINKQLTSQDLSLSGSQSGQSLTAPPKLQLKPNQIAGVVVLTDGSLVSNAIIEVLDSNKRVITAVKSNSLGQFFISQSLPNNNYVIRAKAPNTLFGDHDVFLNGEVVQELVIRQAG